MKLAIGSDHGGFLLKKEIMNQLSGYQWVDCGTYDESSCDYPDFAFKVGEKVASHECDFGIVICKSGIGVSICANKVKGIRCALVDNEKDAVLSKMDPCPGLPEDAVFRLLEKGDQRLTSRFRFCKLYGSLDLGKHGARCKMSFFNVLLRLIYGDVSQPFLIRLSVIDGCFFHGGQDDEEVRVQLFREETACEVFVNDRAGAF